MGSNTATQYCCPNTGIRASFGEDCVPRELEIPDPLFSRPPTELSDLVAAALNAGAHYAQYHGHRDDGRHPHTGARNNGSRTTAKEFADNAPAPSCDGTSAISTAVYIDVAACTARLHGIANMLTDSHHRLLAQVTEGADPSGLVRAHANTAGVVIGLEFSPRFALGGTEAATSAIREAAAAAVRNANQVRASVITEALNAILHASRSQESPTADTRKGSMPIS